MQDVGESQVRAVVKVDARRPADRGLVAFGLAMQLWGVIATIFTAVVLVSMFVMGMFQNFWIPMIIAGALALAIMHFVVGSELRDVAGRAPAMARMLLWAAVIVAAFRILLLWTLSEGNLAMTAIVADLVHSLAWPALLLVALQVPEMRAWFSAIAEGELDPSDRNRGLVGTGIAMTTLGTGAALTGALTLWAQVSASVGGLLADTSGVLMLLALASVMLRGGTFAYTGIALMNGADVPRFAALVRRCVSAHWLSVGLVVTWAYNALPSSRVGGSRLDYGAATPLMLSMMVGIVAAASAWPYILRSHAQRLERREDEELGDGRLPAFGPPVDGGLTTIGWLLLAYAATSLPGALLSAFYPGGGGIGPATNVVPGLTWFAGPQMPWWVAIIGGALAAWAGFEAMKMRALARPAVAAFSLAALATTLIAAYQSSNGGFGAVVLTPQGGQPFMEAATAMSVVLAMVFPVVALVVAARAPQPTDG